MQGRFVDLGNRDMLKVADISMRSNTPICEKEEKKMV